MYCPKCAAENSDGSKFCRRCGSNISLVPQALSGTLRDPSEYDEATANKLAGKVERGITKSLIGLAFVVIAMLMLLSRNRDGWAMLIPAAILIGKGASEILAFRYLRTAGRLSTPKAVQPPPEDTLQQASQPLLDQAIPPSVTEHTTRNMNQPVQDRQ
jgi:hypothetical protein